PLTAGTRIGPYEIKSPLGEGGMGVVFRALDTKLQREVALKLLPDHFADDPERLARFQREAQVLASLNHPNIAQIHGLEDSTAQTCIVMELVEGETLQVTFRQAENANRRLNTHSPASAATPAAHYKPLYRKCSGPTFISLCLSRRSTSDKDLAFTRHVAKCLVRNAETSPSIDLTFTLGVESTKFNSQTKGSCALSVTIGTALA